MKCLGYKVLIVVLSVVCFSCSKELTKPRFIIFDITKDSISVSAVNKNRSPFHIVVNQNSKAVTDTLVLLENDTTPLMRFSSKSIDTMTILKTYKFRASFGNPNMTSYDTLFKYQLPFPKHKAYKVLQGNNTNFTHKGGFSKYALDFRMPVGDTICAARNGYVAGVVEKFSKNGHDESYREFANFITIYHDDGTYSQYVHLKKNGALVEVNQYVKQGEPIGLSGNTGWSSEPHLHFAVFRSVPMNFKSIPFILNDKDSRSIKKWDVLTH